jgi:radical SAM protein with 4Fe4S-binding SPASM domain
LVNVGVCVMSNMVIMKKFMDNFVDFFDMVSFLKKTFGMSRFAFASISPNFKNQATHCLDQEDLTDVLDQAYSAQKDLGMDVRSSRPFPLCYMETAGEKYWGMDIFRGCTMGVAQGLTVSGNGDVKACPVFPKPIANVFNDTLGKIKDALRPYDGTDISALRESSPAACHECSVFDVCKGGCKAESMALNGVQNGNSRYKGGALGNAELLLRASGYKDLLDTKFAFNPRIKVRKDDEEYVVRGERFALLSTQEYQLLRFMIRKGAFSASDYAALFGSDMKALNFFLNKLEKARIIYPADEARSHLSHVC